MNIKELVERIIADGKVTTEEHKILLDAVSEDGKLDEGEAKQIKRVMEMIRSGELTSSG
ncbi:MAG: hypothetical protein GY757_61975 [bacterium]|nr:hypothetical protein [bacterium]